MTPEQRQLILADLDQEIAKAKRKFRKLLALRSFLRRKVKSSGASDSSSASASPSTSTPLQAIRPTKSSAAQAVLRAAGRDNPLRAPEIARRMVEKHGFPARALNNRTLERHIYTVMMRRKDLFLNLGDGRWTLAEFKPSNEETNGQGATADQPA